ncbi:uncharacterized protein ISCGN_033180 [Ixodes scapularis]
MSKILKHLGFGKKPPMPPRVDYNMRSFLGLGMPIRCNSEGNLLEAVAEERAINKMTHRSQDDTQLVLVPDYCDPADLKEQFRKEMGARRKAAAAKVALSKNAVGTLDDDFYSTPYETQRVAKGPDRDPHDWRTFHEDLRERSVVDYGHHGSRPSQTGHRTVPDHHRAQERLLHGVRSVRQGREAGHRRRPGTRPSPRGRPEARSPAPEQFGPEGGQLAYARKVAGVRCEEGVEVYVRASSP